jgi:hypothetical protein
MEIGTGLHTCADNGGYPHTLKLGLVTDRKYREVTLDSDYTQVL